MTRRKWLLAGALALAAACNDAGTDAGCRAIFSGRVTAVGQGVANVNISLSDRDRPAGGPFTTATTSATGEYGLVLNAQCDNCSARIVPPSVYRVAAGDSAQRNVRLQCGETTTLNWQLIRDNPVED